MTAAPRVQITRHPERGTSDRAELDRLLGDVAVAHVGFVADGHPIVLPTAIGRDGDRVVIHGSTGARWMRTLADGCDASIAITALDGLVVARTAFDSSMHYRSAVLFGRLEPVLGDDKLRALDVLTDALIPGRVAEVRRPTPKELAATSVLSMPIETWTLKASHGWPDDEPEDVAGDTWAGVVPLATTGTEALTAPDLRDGIAVPDSVRRLLGEA